MFMFNNNYDVTNKGYLERVQRGYKVNKETEQKKEKPRQNKKQETKKGGKILKMMFMDL